MPTIEYDEVPCPRNDLEGPCHVFRGKPHGDDGYCVVRIGGGRKSLVHRYVWERDVGPIPAGMLVDHQCRVRACCNVKHLRLVNTKQSSTENVVGANWQVLKARTHCINGHEFTAANTRWTKEGRVCRACARWHSKRQRAKADHVSR